MKLQRESIKIKKSIINDRLLKYNFLKPYEIVSCSSIISISFSCSFAKASALSLSADFLIVSTKIGVEINKDEYVPTPIPNNIANTND